MFSWNQRVRFHNMKFGQVTDGRLGSHLFLGGGTVAMNVRRIFSTNVSFVLEATYTTSPSSKH